MKSKMKIFPGRELRGFRFRLYTTQEQDLLLRDTGDKLRSAWNWLCARARDVSDAREAYAARYHGIIAPARPAEGTTSKQIETIWDTYRAECRAWRAEVRRVCKGVYGVKYRSIKNWCEHFGVRNDYQLFAPALGLSDIPVPAGLLQALCKDYQSALQATTRGQAPPRFKRKQDHVTLRTRTGTCLRLRSVGPRPGKRTGSQPGRTDWLNCEVHLPGVGWLPGHIGAEQLPRLEAPEYWVEGVSVVEESDGWYAAIRQWIVPRQIASGSSPDIRWAGYGLPTDVRSDHGRSPNWLRSEHCGWGVEVRDCYPNGVPNDDPVLLDHRWRVSLQRPDGTRMNPNKACPTREQAEHWGRCRVNALIGHQQPGTRLKLAPVHSPGQHGGEVRLGVDSGLANLLTITGPCGDLQTGNSRALDLLETVAERQSQEEPSARLLTQGARRTRHMLRGVLAWLEEAAPEVVQIEDGGSRGKSIATFLATESHGRGRKSGGYVPSAGWLLARAKERFAVREVECWGVTGTCSQCGEDGGIVIDSETRKARCTKCNHEIDQDRGTARNVRRKPAKSKGPSADGSQPQHGSA